MNRRGSSRHAAAGARTDPRGGPLPPLRRRQLKLSYRRHDKAAPHGVQATQTVFILRCADCEGFTTVSA